MFCDKCGSPIAGSDKFCGVCGNDVLPAVPPEQTVTPLDDAPLTTPPQDTVAPQPAQADVAPANVPAPLAGGPVVSNPDAPSGSAAPTPEPPGTANIVPPTPPLPPGNSLLETPPPQAPKKKVKWIIPAVVSLVILASVILIPVILHNKRQARYDEAVLLMDAGEYQKAAEEFLALENFDDSADKAIFCQQSIDYLAAKDLLDKGEYSKALSAFEALGSFKDARTLKTECENALQYLDAQALLAEGRYEDAKTLFDALSGYKDAYQQAQLCQNKLDYIAAADAMAQELYYTAYTGFDALGDFEDAVEQRDSCVQTFPATGEVYRNENYSGRGCSLEIRPPASDQSNNYVKIYSESGDLVSILAIASGQRASVWLPAGTYKIKAAYGYSNWYGEKELFGDAGHYQVLTFDDEGTDAVQLLYNYIYTLSLRSATSDSGGDSVGTYNQSRDEF